MSIPTSFRTIITETKELVNQVECIEREGKREREKKKEKQNESKLRY